LIRVVLDANVYASALINKTGAPGMLLARAFRDRAFQIVASREILLEVGRALKYPRVRKRAKMSEIEIDEFVACIADMALLARDHDEAPKLSRDPDDDKYIAVAKEGLAGFIVTGDRDLLDLGQHGEIRILTPREFLAVLD
jgi:putative PIN family toxin of toxin-antitoxin system